MTGADIGWWLFAVGWMLGVAAAFAAVALAAWWHERRERKRRNAP